MGGLLPKDNKGSTQIPFWFFTLQITNGNSLKMKKFADYVKDALELAVKQHGTQKALADATGVSEPNISRWLKGRDPRVREISPVLDLMGATLSFEKGTTTEEKTDISSLRDRISELEAENARLGRANAKLEGAVETLESQLDKFRDKLSSSQNPIDNFPPPDRGVA